MFSIFVELLSRHQDFISTVFKFQFLNLGIDFYVSGNTYIYISWFQKVFKDFKFIFLHLILYSRTIDYNISSMIDLYKYNVLHTHLKTHRKIFLIKNNWSAVFKSKNFNHKKKKLWKSHNYNTLLKHL